MSIDYSRLRSTPARRLASGLLDDGFELTGRKEAIVINVMPPLVASPSPSIIPPAAFLLEQSEA